MIQGADAAYARSRYKFFQVGKISDRCWRRNLAPILGECRFLCCASPLHCAASHNL